MAPGQVARVLTPKQLEFIKLYAVSKNATEAYGQAYGVDHMAGSNRASAARLLAYPEVQAELARMSRPYGHGKVLSLSQIQGFLYEVATTPAGEITRDHMLCEQITPTEHGDKLAMPSKMDAVKLSAKLSGHMVERVQSTHTLMPLGSVLSGLCGIVGAPPYEPECLHDDHPELEQDGECDLSTLF